ncbi:MAG: large conductance mechanosensitive channel protein MscL [Clostridiales Family XIII bacterium]|jgi:large conductance mechanosensitive channel|nr:large conductance mechanosensitive channel protein MscL [Clostridiales Family XIII bacterium]
MKKLLGEFREFAFKGNVMDLAIGVLIGAAFQGVISSLTSDILSPVIGLFTRRNFDMLELNIFGVDIRYGAFVTSVVNFLIMAFVIFLLVKVMTVAGIRRVAPADAEKKPPARKCPHCIGEIDEAATRCPHCTSVLTRED